MRIQDMFETFIYTVKEDWTSIEELHVSFCSQESLEGLRKAFREPAIL